MKLVASPQENNATEFRIGGFFLIATLGVLVYGNHLQHPFQFDTVDYIEKQNLSDPGGMLTLRFFVEQFYSRGLLQMSLAVNTLLGNKNPFGYHLFNLLFHIINASMVFLISEKVLRHLGNRRAELLRSREIFCISLFSGLLFVSHPLQTESVLYIMSRSEILAATFYLLAFYRFQSWLESSKKKPPSTGIWLTWASIGVLFLLGFSVKQTLITLPATLILYFLCQSPANSQVFVYLKRYKWVLAVLSFTALALLLHKLLADETFLVGPVNPDQMVGRKNYMQTQPWVMVFYYLKLLLFPINLNIDPDIPVITRFFSIPLFLSLSVMAIVLYQATRKSTSRIHLFGLGWFVIVLSPSSSIITLNDLAAEHRVYLATYGIILTLILLAWKTIQIIFENRRESKHLAATTLAIALLVSLGLMTIQRNLDWRSEQALWEDTRKKSPYLLRPLINLARAHHLAGNTKTAVHLYQESLKKAPNSFISNYNLGELQFAQGNIEEAMRLLLHAKKIKPEIPEVHGKLGELFQKQGHYEKAARHYQTAVELNPQYATAMRNLGWLNYYHLDNPKLGRLYFSRTLTLDPNQPQAEQIRQLIVQILRPKGPT